MWHHQVTVGSFRIGFTNSQLDVAESSPDLPAALSRLSRAWGGVAIARMSQVHGVTVCDADPDTVPTADALIIESSGVAAMARSADCVPVAVVDHDGNRAAVIHAGRVGMLAGVVDNTIEQMRARGSSELVAWVGPAACGRCYEVDAPMAAEAAQSEPAVRATTSWGTPAIDVVAGVKAQLARHGVETNDVGGCTIEDDRFHSYRRQGPEAGRMAVVVEMMS